MDIHGADEQKGQDGPDQQPSGDGDPQLLRAFQGDAPLSQLGAQGQKGDGQHPVRGPFQGGQEGVGQVQAQAPDRQGQ